MIYLVFGLVASATLFIERRLDIFVLFFLAENLRQAAIVSKPAVARLEDCCFDGDATVPTRRGPPQHLHRSSSYSVTTPLSFTYADVGFGQGVGLDHRIGTLRRERRDRGVDRAELSSRDILEGLRGVLGLHHQHELGEVVHNWVRRI
jgi:hypothetical protein